MEEVDRIITEKNAYSPAHMFSLLLLFSCPSTPRDRHTENEGDTGKGMNGIQISYGVPMIVMSSRHRFMGHNSLESYETLTVYTFLRKIQYLFTMISLINIVFL